ncbi:hypothetical protein LAZ67_7001736 [Cordylochernes scorpioides]|uniref:Transposase n=1 Tax=Cordylochernes scorpioides TaxID=51811 RepID=A0ABY6KMJ8_9ARAC|nr:hypothetical protein LAZ67_7001736 [Cordylochernes scorpioides]
MPKMEFKGEVFHDALKKQENLNIGSDVYFRKQWKLGTILKLLSCRHYLIGYEDQSFKRHINQLRPVKERPEATVLKDPRVPGMTTNGVLLSNEMTPQTITPCCGPVWCSTVRPGSTRCPGRLQTRLRRASGHKSREDVNDEDRAGCPSTSTTDEKINEVEKMILANRRITVREVAEDLNISIGSCHSISINDLGMRLVAAKFVPKLLNCDQKQHRMNIANEMLDSVRDDPNLLQRVITGDEAWVYGYDVETKSQSSQWKLPHEPRLKKVRQVRSNVKVFLTVFFDCRGVVHHEFLPQGRTVNKEYYLQVMRNLREAISQKRLDLWKNKNWLLHHDNAPAHTSLLVRDFLAKNNTLMMPQPPYSPDLAP